MPKISILHPSRQRPEQAFKTFKHWMSLAQNPNDIEYILSIDESDPDMFKYCDLFTDFVKNLNNTVLISPNKSAIEAVNSAAKASKGDILITISDDFRAHKRWDTNIIRIAGNRTDWVMKTQDKTQPWIITLPIMDRAFYNRFGYVYYPGYKHLFPDTELTTVGDYLKRTINAKILLFEHQHYSTGKSTKDAVSEKADSTWMQGETLYLERYKKNFDLKPEEIKGKITAPHHIKWLRSKGIKI